MDIETLIWIYPAVTGESDEVLEVPNIRHRLVARPSPFIKSNNFGGGFGEY